jgi:serine/threonine protein phosphatase 1
MFKFFKTIWPKGKPAASGARMPDGQRVYAVGDIHGRLDLFTALIEAMEADDAAATPARTTMIQQQREVRILAGNHEEMFLKSFSNIDVLRHFLRHGGRETLLSFGVDKAAYSSATIEEVQALMHVNVSEDERAFIEGFEDMIPLGDYLFVHAGIDPELPIEEQKGSDLRWIREPFLSHQLPHEAMIVHGHTIAEHPVETANRIGIDTGAYATGRLTALVLEGTERRFITAIGSETGQIRIEHKQP